MMETFLVKYGNFKLLLESNSELLKILSDIESKLRELQGDVDEGLDAARSVGAVVAVGAAVVLVVAAYWFGRRRGRKRQTILEIRRI